MKSSVALFSICLCSTIACGQSTSSSAKSTGRSSTGQSSTGPSAAGQSSSPGSSSTSGSASQLRVRGPEAVAQQDPNRVVATIGGKQVTARQASDMLKALPAADRKKLEANLPAVLQQLYMTEQIAGEAAKMGLDQQEPWKNQLQLNRDNILTQAYLTKPSASLSQEAKTYYDGHVADFDQIKLSGILVAFSPPGTPAGGAGNPRTEAQAQEKVNDLEKKIKAGGDFSALARTDSDSQQSSTRGGDLGSFVMADPNLPPDIKTPVSKLQSGQVSEPVRIPGGFWIFKVNSRSKLPFDQVRPSIVQKMEQDKYKIQVQDQDFFNASTGPSIPSLQRPGASSQPQSKP